MKVNFILLSFLLITSINGLSQGFNAGILAGVNASQVSGDGINGFNKAGLLIGLYTNVDVSPKINLQFEINYSEKGSRKNPKPSKGDNDFLLLRTNYVEIPAMIRFKKRAFTYEAGTYYARLINDHLEDENGVFEIARQFNQFNKNDIGVLLGLNYNFTDHLIMNWRISSSVITFREFDSGASFRFDNGLFHHYLSFNFRYQFAGTNEE